MIPTLATASPWIWAGLAIAEFALPVFLGLVIGLLPSMRPFFAGDRSGCLLFWMTTLAALWITTLVFVALMFQGGVSVGMVGLRVPERTASEIAGAVVATLALGALVLSARTTGAGPAEQPALFLPHARHERLLIVLVIAPSAAVCEEVLYRGFVLAFLQPVIGFWPANLVQSLLFGFHHGGITQGTVALLSRAAIGVVFGGIAASTGTLTAVIAIHFVFDAVLALRPSPEAAAEAA